MFRVWRLVAVLALAATDVSARQNVAPPPLFGLVTDITGHPLRDVIVSVHRAGEGTLNTVETDSSGRYDINLAPGKYSVDFDLVAFDVRRMNDVTIPTSGLASPLDATLGISVLCDCGARQVDVADAVVITGRIAD